MSVRDLVKMMKAKEIWPLAYGAVVVIVMIVLILGTMYSYG